MNFSKKRLRIAGLLLGMTMFGSIFAGCGGDGPAALCDMGRCV